MNAHVPLVLSAMLLGCAVPSGPAAPGQAPPSDFTWEVHWIESPAGPDAVHPVLDRGADGIVRLLWSEPWGEHGARVCFAALEGSEFGTARTIAEVEQAFLNWVDVPALAALADGTLAATWLEKTSGDTYSYGVRYGVSQDGGRTWRGAGQWLHEDRSPTEHGFVSLIARDDDFLGLWLDGRATLAGGPQQLWSRSLGRDGVPRPERLVDGSVCDCCSTFLLAGARARGEIWAAWRGRTQDEVRDIRVGRLAGQGWEPLGTVHDDGWVIPGCPVNGPRLARAGSLPVCVWTSGEERNGAWIAAWGPDGFREPEAVNGFATFGRLGSAELGDGSVLVSWLEQDPEGGARWQLRRYHEGPGGDLVADEPWTLDWGSADRAAGVLRLAAAGEGAQDGAIAAWNGEPGEGLRIARLVPTPR